MATKIGYKVVQALNGKLWSFNESVAGPGRRRYIRGKPTVPAKGCGLLCVFETQKNAERLVPWDSCVPGFRIYRCEYEPGTDNKVYWKRPIWQRWRRGFTQHASKRDFDALCRSYPGTVLAKSVTLLKRVR